MLLSQLLKALPTKRTHGNLGVNVCGLASDSRLVRPGDLFVAIHGLNTDGHNFIPQAIERGAIAIVAERELPPSSPELPFPSEFPVILVPDSRAALAYLAAAWHGYPARQMRVVGVTGTDGKTTTVNLIHSILAAAGHKTGMISTVNALIGDTFYDTGLHTTTPDAPDIQRLLAQMVETDTEYAVLEVTSHGLDQHRVTACDFDVAVVTNVTHEHLDYHGTYQAYLEAKARLFHALTASARKPDTPKIAVLNADDNSFAYFRPIPADWHLTYGLDAPADVTAAEISSTPEGIAFVAHTPRGNFSVRSPLIGRYNVYNFLAAITVGISQNLPIPAIQQGIAAVRGVVGRMEHIDAGQPFTVIVDFAHTPNSLQRALETVRELTSGQVIVVFGCAGLRDRFKRPVMGEIAGRLADQVVITAEDPRTESLDDIMAQIAAGCEKAGRHEGKDYWRIGDRAEAIAFAVRLARPGDLVLVTGKGHEQSMCFGTTEYPWSDHQAVRKALTGF
ncbi:MAG: UDP-N-acetylmuramoyl-L-alanyl-D-glutamate--2,6-diaminopimelate ligase [Anaerolineae bacterium]|jgi:UDP-N-acetylmuramoyl-L-alanyl-D-glutamate--2,6-diaminopimelate ligase|nr:UDP-N-acetylmuramoyl-L-alanyl-D-glutamate--2,6-diaminopimelate ligase [Anaerolineae bacterium]MDH7474851.1 UDP-N-acetylmuramoyl-L-alanyl-D-glutamate--2,6-diaminopimelate ligase [Anaerolineae bacterium]